MARRAPALGTFLTQLRQRLAGLPPEELRGVLLTHAERLPADARADFLSIFPDPEHRTVSRPAGQWIDLDDLDDRVRDLAVRVASGEFGDPDGGDDWDYGYDWGGPEWGAEEARVPDWVAEASGLVDDASQLFLSGDPEQGRAAFGLVLAMFGITTESDPPADIALEIAYLEPATVDEMLARYLRCVYETSAPADRATALRHAWSSLPWRIEPLRLTDVIEARAQPLPDLAGFLPDWIDLLVSDETWPPQRDGVRLLAEAARLHPGPDPMAGLDTLADLAQRPGRHRGGINLVRVDALAAAGRTRDAAEAAVTALSLPDLTPELRAAIADRLADIAIDLGDLDDAIAARVTAWRAQPSRVRLLALVADARTAGVPDTTLAAEAKRISAAARRTGAGLPDRLSCELLLLAGRDDLAVKALIAAAPLGWSNSAHPGPVVLPYLWAASGEIPARGQLRSLFEQMDQQPLRHLLASPHDIAAALDDAIRSIDIGRSAGTSPGTQLARPTLTQALTETLSRRRVSDRERTRLLTTAQSVVDSRIAAIVTNKYRGAYARAAALAVAHAEALAVRSPVDGVAYLAEVRGRYPRHVAFRGELDAATAASALSRDHHDR